MLGVHQSGKTTIPAKFQPTAVMQMKDDIQESEEKLTLTKYGSQDGMFLSLIHAVLKIREDMMATPG